MNWIPVVSSNLAAVAYEDASGNLYIRFRNGGEYVYYNVPSSVHSDLMDASSKGSYHVNFIKYHYRNRKL